MDRWTEADFRMKSHDKRNLIQAFYLKNNAKSVPSTLSILKSLIWVSEGPGFQTLVLVNVTITVFVEDHLCVL